MMPDEEIRYIPAIKAGEGDLRAQIQEQAWRELMRANDMIVPTSLAVKLTHNGHTYKGTAHLVEEGDKQESMPGEPNVRDTHFAGFAKMLVEEIERYVDANGWINRFGYIDGVCQEVLPSLETLIAQRAYDLLIHDRLHTATSDLQHAGSVLEAQEMVNNIPDMQRWPEK